MGACARARVRMRACVRACVHVLGCVCVGGGARVAAGQPLLATGHLRPTNASHLYTVVFIGTVQDAFCLLTACSFA